MGPALQFAIKRGRHRQHLVHRFVTGVQSQHRRYQMTYDAGVESVTANRNSTCGDNRVLARSGLETDHAEVAGPPAEIGNENQFAGAKALRIRVSCSNRLVRKVDLVETGDGVSSAQPPKSEFLVHPRFRAYEANGPPNRSRASERP